MAKDLIRLSPRELKYYEVISKVLAGKLTNRQAAGQLSVSIRQVKRLKPKVKNHGADNLAHGNRGRIPVNKLTDEIRQKVSGLVKKHYWDFGPTFASEKLLENHQIKISKETLRQIMASAGLWQARPKKEKPHYRAWRERKDSFGEMQQFDGCYHDWFEGRLLNEQGQAITLTCLLASIDDATGKLTKLKFDDSEGVVPVNRYWREYVKTLGKPLSIYLDRNVTYKINNKHLLDDPKVLTQFERAMRDLDIEVIHAYSPQGKGRVERLFETLQDRLVKEMRLAGIKTITEANEFLEKIFLPKFNDKFSVLPKKPDNAHTPLTEIELSRLEGVFAIHNYRHVNNDFTVRFKGKWLQLSEQQPTTVLRKDQILIEERLDGSIHLKLRDKYLSYTALPERPSKINMHVTALTREKQIWKPPINHPWKKLSFEKNQRRP